MLTVQAFAKLNLALEVRDRRPDGYHELVSVMQLVDLADSLEIGPDEDVRLSCSDPALAGPDNLVLRAARLLRSRFDVRDGCWITLRKRIPAAAGLGGGSSDAAAALVALNRFWGAGVGCAELSTLAEELGSDVPFFLYGGTALVEGRGETVTRISDPEPAWYVLAKPAARASTAAIYAELRRDEWTDGRTAHDLACAIARERRPTIGPNSLQAPLFRLVPEARRCFEALSALAPGRTFVTGSGPTVAAIFEDPHEAERVAASLQDPNCWVAICRTHSIRGWEAPCA